MSIGAQRNIQGRVPAGQAIRVALEKQGQAWAVVPRVIDFGSGRVEVVVYTLDPKNVEKGIPGAELERIGLGGGEQGRLQTIPDTRLAVTGVAPVQVQSSQPTFRLISNRTAAPLGPVTRNPCCVTCGKIEVCGCAVEHDCDSCCDHPQCCPTGGFQAIGGLVLYRPFVPGLGSSCAKPEFSTPVIVSTEE